jgi:NADH dehydrogenase FAD-containing subunit
LWSIPAGLVHPHCRGSWAIVGGGETGIDPELAEQIRSLMPKTHKGNLP